MTERIAAEVFHPGEFLSEELEAREWSQADLASILGCTERLVSEVISGKRSVSPATARALGAALGTGGQFWLNLEAAYQLHRLAQSEGESKDVAKRAAIFEKAPVREMVRRGWIEDSDDPEVLEQRVLGHLGISTLDEDPDVWPFAARKSTGYESVTPAQWAWLSRAKHLAEAVDAGKFSTQSLKSCLASLRPLLANPADIQHVPRVLADSGIRLVVVEHLRGSKIDGACFWLDKTSPVVALSLRYDRLDGFWYSLLHELGHVSAGDGLKPNSLPIDIGLVGATGNGSPEKPPGEQKADAFATEFLVDQERLQEFMARVAPLYSKRLIREFAESLGVHPGLVVGQLQYQRAIPWSHSRQMLVKVRDILTPSAPTDGWGFAAAVRRIRRAKTGDDQAPDSSAAG